MKQEDYEKVLRELPVFKAVFEVVRVPNWASDKVKVGDRNEVNGFNGCAIQPSYIKFVGYKQVSGERR